jgi:UDP-N-acetylglucosamine--N-acetylmuramyl-(pentapeptide) pyrophosphoryl-undecaprenol N-acetylglucosamine transferase
MRLVVSGGGTGGHIYPALSIAAAVRQKDPHAEVLYIGRAGGLEQELAQKAGITFKGIPATGFKRKLTLQNFKTIYTAFQGVALARRIIRSFHPDVVVGTGGYVSGPVVLSARLEHIPALVQEQNAFPGVTNRLLSRIVNYVAVSHEEAKRFLPGRAKVVVAGNPIRPEFMTARREEGLNLIGAPSDAFVIVVTGGSGGARVLNEAVTAAAQGLLKSGPNTRLVFITGSKYFDAVSKALGPVPAGMTLLPYTHDMPELLAAADLFIGRSGGMVAEVCARGLPSILVPSPNVANNHQEHNARAMESAGASVVIRETELTPELLVDTAEKIRVTPGRLKEMSASARTLGHPDAANTIAGLVFELVRHK